MMPGEMIANPEGRDRRTDHLFTDYDCQTARYVGFAGLKNWTLLLAAEAAGFDVHADV